MSTAWCLILEDRIPSSQRREQCCSEHILWDVTQEGTKAMNKNRPVGQLLELHWLLFLFLILQMCQLGHFLKMRYVRGWAMKASSSDQTLSSTYCRERKTGAMNGLCVPPKSMLKPKPQCDDGGWGEVFGRSLGHEGTALMNGVRALIRDPTELSTMWKNFCNLEEGLTRIQPI